MKLHPSKFSGWLAAGAMVLACSSHAGSSAQGVEFVRQPDRVEVKIHGELFTSYWFTNVPKPYCYPVLAPGGISLSRDWPMRETPGEQHDHPHHRGLWYAHGDVNGVDFWTEQPTAGVIVHAGFLELKSGDTGVLRTTNRWVAPDGRMICTDERTLRFQGGPANTRMLDFEITFFAGAQPLVFGDTKEGCMAFRVAESMRVAQPPKAGSKKAEPGAGHILTSSGAKDAAAWGTRAAWCDYSGPIGAKVFGLAIFDHPDNPRHPTWWHVRDYGLFAANPFGQHDFEKLAAQRAGDFTVSVGGRVTFRYRFYFHEGGAAQAGVVERWDDYRRPTPAK